MMIAHDIANCNTKIHLFLRGEIKMFETAPKFGKRTGLSPSAIRKMVKANQLPYVMVGNRPMIHIEKGLAVLASLAERVGA